MQSTWSRWFLIISIYSMIPHIHGQVKFDKDRFVLEIQANSMPMDRIQSMLPERCGGKNKTDRIVSAEKSAPLTQWPWMARLRGSGGGFDGWLCGGGLISDRYVLTAAHCVVHRVYTVEFVRLGEPFLNQHSKLGNSRRAPTPQDINLDKVIVHPQYKSPCLRCNDIALIKLASPARLDDLFVKPICISGHPSIDVEFSPSHSTNLKAWVAGRGSSTQYPSVFSQPVQDLPFCLDRKLEYPDPNMIFCAGDKNGSDSCRGDSGGPLMLASKDHAWYAIGIISFGNAICGSLGSQTVFTNVSYYLPWIEETLLL